MTDQEFFDYWKNVHGPIGARIPGLRKLIQSHRITVRADSHAADYDGIAELWFDNEEALLTARSTPEWQASTEDEANFIDHTRAAYLVAEEYVIEIEVME